MHWQFYCASVYLLKKLKTEKKIKVGLSHLITENGNRVFCSVLQNVKHFIAMPFIDLDIAIILKRMKFAQIPHYLLYLNNASTLSSIILDATYLQSQKIHFMHSNIIMRENICAQHSPLRNCLLWSICSQQLTQHLSSIRNGLVTFLNRFLSLLYENNFSLIRLADFFILKSFRTTCDWKSFLQSILLKINQQISEIRCKHKHLESNNMHQGRMGSFLDLNDQ
jgi:hypothetical protein